MGSNPITATEQKIVSMLRSVTAFKHVLDYEPTTWGTHSSTLPAISIKVASWRRNVSEFDSGKVLLSWDMIIWCSLVDPAKAQKDAKNLLWNTINLFKTNTTLDNTVVKAQVTEGEGFIPVKIATETVLACPIIFTVEAYE